MTSELGGKLLDVQTQIEAVKKTATNPYFKSKYVDLNQVLEACKVELNKRGLYVLQPCGKDSFGAYVQTLIQDKGDGMAVESKVYLTGNEKNMQEVGSSITYARRYGLISLLALEAEDDDGELTAGRGKSIVKEIVKTTPISAAKSQPTSPDFESWTAPPVSFQKAIQNVKEVFPGTEDITNNREVILADITACSGIAIAKGKTSREKLIKHIREKYKVDKKENLSLEQAKEFLSYLEDVANNFSLTS